MRASTVAAVAAALVTAGPAAAAADRLPTGRVSVQVGAKASTGAFASRMGLGFAYGFEAAYQPLRADQRLGLGLSWATTWSTYGEGSARVAGCEVLGITWSLSNCLAMLEMMVGARVRVPLGVRRRQVLFLGGGVALIRVNEPPVQDGDRSYVGPWAAAGVESLLFGLQVGVEARYVLTSSDDGTIGFLLSVGSGR